MTPEEKLRHDADALIYWARLLRACPVSLVSVTGQTRARAITASLDGAIRDATELSGLLIDLANAEAQKGKK